MIFAVSPKNSSVVSMFPLLVSVLDLHINPDGEWRYLDGLWGVWITIALGSGVEEEVCGEV